MSKEKDLEKKLKEPISDKKVFSFSIVEVAPGLFSVTNAYVGRYTFFTPPNYFPNQER